LKKIIEIEGNEHIINHHEKKIVLSKIVFNVQIKQLGNWTPFPRTHFGYMENFIIEIVINGDK